MGNSRMKMSVFIVVLMLLSFTVGAYAADGIKEVTAFLRDDYKIVLDGRKVQLENTALFYNDYSYLPLRELGLLLGLEIGWDDKTKTVSLTTPTDEVIPDTTLSNPSNDSSSGNNTPSDVQYPVDFMFSNALIYKITMNSKVYFIFANDENGMMYFRRSDVELMGIDLSGLKTVKEKETSELYYPVNELSARLKNPGQFEVTNDTIIRETNAEKLKVLKAFSTRTTYEKVFYIKAVPGIDQYVALVRDENRRFLFHKLKLSPNVDGSYYVGSVTGEYLYD